MDMKIKKVSPWTTILQMFGLKKIEVRIVHANVPKVRADAPKVFSIDTIKAAARGEAGALADIEKRMPGFTPQFLDGLQREGILEPLLDRIGIDSLTALCRRADYRSALVVKKMAERAGGDMDAMMTLESISGEWKKEYIEYLAHCGFLSAILERLSDSTVTALAKRLPELSCNKDDLSGARDIFVLRILHLAKDDRPGAHECLDNLSQYWNESYLQHLADRNTLSSVLGIISLNAIFKLIKKMKSHHNDDFNSPRDQITHKVLELAMLGDPAAIGCLINEAKEWDEPYRQHLAKFDVLDLIEQTIKPKTFSSITEALFSTVNRKPNG